MDALLLIGPQGSELKRLKSHLLKQGFQAVSGDPEDLDRLAERQGRFLLGILAAGKGNPLQDLISRVRKSPACGDLPLVALVQQEQFKQLLTLRGLEDYLILPASPEMVEARVRFVLSRLNHLAPGAGKRIGALEINVDRYEILLDGEPLELTYKEFELFKFLATHPGRVFSRDQLLNQVWGYNFIGGTRTVDVHVRRLRAKLGPKHATLIDTVRNVGYKFLENL